MTTPKRYEEMAEGWACDTGCLCNMHKDDLVEALRTAAREAQVRVLEELEGRIDGYEVVFDSIRERLDSGEDF